MYRKAQSGKQIHLSLVKQCSNLVPIPPTPSRNGQQNYTVAYKKLYKMLISPRLGEGCCVRQAIRHEWILPPSWMRSFFHHPTLMPGYNKNMPAEPPFCGCFLPYQGQTGCHKPNGAFQTTSTGWHRCTKTDEVTWGLLYHNCDELTVKFAPASILVFSWILMSMCLFTGRKVI